LNALKYSVSSDMSLATGSHCWPCTISPCNFVLCRCNLLVGRGHWCPGRSLLLFYHLSFFCYFTAFCSCNRHPAITLRLHLFLSICVGGEECHHNSLRLSRTCAKFDCCVCYFVTDLVDRLIDGMHATRQSCRCLCNLAFFDSLDLFALQSSLA